VGRLWVRLGKIKCAAIWGGLCGCIAALLILRSVGILSFVFLSVYGYTVGLLGLQVTLNIYDERGFRTTQLSARDGDG